MFIADSSTLKSESEVQQGGPADDPERRRVLLDLADGVDDARDRAAREGALQLRHQVARLVRPPREGEQGDGQEQQRHEREQREVGDHRGEVRPPVGEELGHGRRQRRHGSEYGRLAFLGREVLASDACRPPPRLSTT
jgi:hypothetical protein